MPIRLQQNMMADILKLFFSFSGTINRREFWLARLGLWLNAVIWVAVFENADVILIMLSIAIAWSDLAIQVKRWHDRNKSGFWVLINFIPYVGSIWSIIELGFMPGREASSSYSKFKEQQAEEYAWRQQEAEFREQERRKMAEEEARKAQEEYTRRKAYAEQHEYQERMRSPPPPLPEEMRFAKALGLNGKVSKDDIKKKYRALVHKYHPDKVSHLGDEFKELATQKFREINEAYEYFRGKYGIN